MQAELFRKPNNKTDKNIQVTELEENSECNWKQNQLYMIQRQN